MRNKIEKYRKDLSFGLVKRIYADHNSSSKVRDALRRVLSHLSDDEFGLNVGAGTTNIHPRVRNLDIEPGKHIHYIGRAEAIPERDDFFKVVITQEVLEHVQDPFRAAEEMYRVLAPGGKLYCQLPFIIGYHPGPTDFWRFTREGIVSMIEGAGFTIEEQGIAVGGGTGCYRVLVEFLAVLFSLPLAALYRPLKLMFALLLYPLKWLDSILNLSPQRDRIAGGYYIIALKN